LFSNRPKNGKALVSIPEYKSEDSMDCDGGRAAKKGEQIYISMKDYPFGVLPLANVDVNGNLVEFADMVKLPYLHEVRIGFLRLCIPSFCIGTDRLYLPTGCYSLQP
jgi:hypothetical protein